MPRLHDTIIDDRKEGYKEGDHYKYFYRRDHAADRNLSANDPVKKSSKRFLYLTYGGLLRCLYVSRSKNADKFQQWATDILFTHQFGSTADRQKLASKLTGATSQVVKEFCKTSSVPISCIYLFTLGTAKDLRDSMKINEKYNDEMIICKYGKTDDLDRRTKEHMKTYGSIKGCHLTLQYHSYIDKKYIQKAETYIENQLTNKVEYMNHTELVAIDKKTLIKKIKDHYKVMQVTYAGNIEQLYYKINELEHKLNLEKANTIIEKEKINAEKEKFNVEREKHNTEKERLIAEISLKDSEMKTLRLQHELEIMKLQYSTGTKKTKN